MSVQLRMVSVRNISTVRMVSVRNISTVRMVSEISAQ